MVEEWKGIPGYEGSYQVSDQGRVRSLDRVVTRGGLEVNYRGRLLSLISRSTSGYLECTIYIAGNGRTFLVHRLVMLAFVGKCPTGMYVCHNDGNPQNNRLGNLRYDTPKMNQADRVLHGTRIVGERHGRSKLTEDDVRRIRLRLANGESKGGIAGDFGVCRTQISNIGSGKAWSHLT